MIQALQLDGHQPRSKHERRTEKYGIHYTDQEKFLDNDNI